MTHESHADRAHAQWSASATARNWTCAGALAMATIAPEDKESIHAARGTAAHTIAEKALRADGDCGAFLGTVEKTKSYEIEIDEELVNSAQMYVDYCRKALITATTHFLEARFSLEQLEPPFEAGGTCDFIAVWEDVGLLEVVDLKNGRGVVEVNENKQTRTYALLALLNLPKQLAAKIRHIKVTIVQPRASHKDGLIRSETFHVADLVDWTHQLMLAMNRSADAMAAFNEINGNRVLFDEWSEKWLTPGNCVFCPAEGLCPKLRSKALSATPKDIQQWFEEPGLPQPAVKNMPALMSPEEIAHTLDGLEMLEQFISAVRATAHAMAERGVEIPGYQLAEKIGNRAWAAPDEKVAADLRMKCHLTDDQIYTRKLASPAQIEKIIGAKRKDEIKNMFHNPVKGTNLVSATKTTRQAAPSKPELFFEKPEEK